MGAQPQTSQGPNLGMTVTTFENPMGIDGFEFVEFAAPEGQGEAMHDYFARMGFNAVLRHTSRPITIYRQGGVNFLDRKSKRLNSSHQCAPSIPSSALQKNTP